MDISSAGPSVSSLAAAVTVQKSQQVQQQFGLAMVKKTMDDQQLVADKLLSMLQPLGQNLDIRA